MKKNSVDLIKINYIFEFNEIYGFAKNAKSIETLNSREIKKEKIRHVFFFCQSKSSLAIVTSTNFIFPFYFHFAHDMCSCSRKYSLHFMHCKYFFSLYFIHFHVSHRLLSSFRSFVPFQHLHVVGFVHVEVQCAKNSIKICFGRLKAMGLQVNDDFIAHIHN